MEVGGCRDTVLILALGLAWGQTTKARKTDAQIKQEIITESIASYRGSCPCPYNTDRAGRRCGARNAYSRRGGRPPDLLRTGRNAEDGGRLSQEDLAVVWG